MGLTSFSLGDCCGTLVWHPDLKTLSWLGRVPQTVSHFRLCQEETLSVLAGFGRRSDLCQLSLPNCFLTTKMSIETSLARIWVGFRTRSRSEMKGLGSFQSSWSPTLTFVGLLPSLEFHAMNEQGPHRGLGLSTPSGESSGHPARAFPISTLPPPSITKRLRSNTATVTLKIFWGYKLASCRHVLLPLQKACSWGRADYCKMESLPSPLGTRLLAALKTKEKYYI